MMLYRGAKHYTRLGGVGGGLFCEYYFNVTAPRQYQIKKLQVVTRQAGRETAAFCDAVVERGGSRAGERGQPRTSPAKALSQRGSVATRVDVKQASYGTPFGPSRPSCVVGGTRSR